MFSVCLWHIYTIAGVFMRQINNSLLYTILVLMVPFFLQCLSFDIISCSFQISDICSTSSSIILFSLLMRQNRTTLPVWHIALPAPSTIFLQLQREAAKLMFSNSLKTGLVHISNRKLVQHFCIQPHSVVLMSNSWIP